MSPVWTVNQLELAEASRQCYFWVQLPTGSSFSIPIMC